MTRNKLFPIKKATAVFVFCAVLFTCLFVCLSSAAMPESGKCGENVNYTYHDGTLTITGTGPMTDYYYLIEGDSSKREIFPPWYGIGSISEVAVGEGVTAIGDMTFRNTSIGSLTLPSTLTWIGEAAFDCARVGEMHVASLESWCSVAIRELYSTPVSETTEVYIGDEPMSGELVVPETVTKLQNHAFANFSAITSVKFHKGMTASGVSAFENCKNLKSVTIDDISDWYGISFPNYSANPMSNGAVLYAGGKKVTSLTLPDGLTEICPWAFAGMTQLDSIAIPESVTSIGSGAFENCTSLETVVLPSGITGLDYSTFAGCTSLRSVPLPEGLTSIDNLAFRGCSALEEINLPDPLVFIGNCAFENCTALKKIVIPEKVASISSYAFNGCTELETVDLRSGASVGWHVFFACPKLTYLFLSENCCNSCEGFADVSPEYVFFAGTKAGWNNKNLIFGNSPVIACEVVPTDCRIEDGIVFNKAKTVLFAYPAARTDKVYSVPEGVRSIADGAFENNSSLRVLLFPSTLAALGSRACADMQKLSCVYLPSSLKLVGNEAFSGSSRFSVICTPMTAKQFSAVNVGSGNSVFAAAERIRTSMPVKDNGGLLTDDGKTYLYSYPSEGTSLMVPAGVEKIAAYAFADNTVLENIALPGSLGSIGRYAFSGCTALRSVLLPGGVTAVNEGAFAGCKKLAEVKMPDKLTVIGACAFKGCSALGEIGLPYALTEIGDEAFADCASLSVFFLPDNISYIGRYAFCGCTALTRINVPGKTTLGQGAFSGCRALTSAYFAQDITSLPAELFRGCTSLKTVSLPLSLISTDEKDVFADCTSLTSLYYAGSTYDWNGIRNLSYGKLPSSAAIIFRHTHCFGSAYKPASDHFYPGMKLEKCSVCGERRIAKTDASECRASLSFTKAAYNGSAKKPSVTVKTNEGKKLVKDTDYTVTYSSNTKIGKAKVTVTFRGNYTGKKTLYFTIRPGNVTGLKATQTTGTVKLSWKKVPGAVTYRIYKYNSSAKKYVQIGSTKDLSYTVTGLKKGTAYTYFVRAGKTVNGVKYLSAKYVRLRTATKPSTPAAPVLTAGTKKITVKWSKVSGATGYELYMKKSGSSSYSRIYCGTKTSFTKTSLKKGSTCYFRLRAYKLVDGKKICSAYSPVKNIKPK